MPGLTLLTLKAMERSPSFPTRPSLALNVVEMRMLPPPLRGFPMEHITRATPPVSSLKGQLREN